MIDDRVARAIERACQDFLGQRHADGIRESLAKRARRSLDADLHVAFRMPGGTLSDLAKVPEFIEAQWIAAKISNRVEQHRAVAVGQDEPVAIVPVRVAWVMT